MVMAKAAMPVSCRGPHAGATIREMTHQLHFSCGVASFSVDGDVVVVSILDADGQPTLVNRLAVSIKRARRIYTYLRDDATTDLDWALLKIIACAQVGAYD